MRKDPALTKEQVIEHCKQHLTGYKVPKIVEFWKELPKTNVGKVLRREVKNAPPADAADRTRRSPMAKLNINGKSVDVQVEADTPLLWVLREQVGLTGTKYGCGVAQCGSCSVHVNGEAAALLRRCRWAALKPTDRIVTIEGLAPQRHARRCRRPGPRSTCRSAATASRARSWRRPRCSRRTRSPATPTSTRR